MCRVVHGEKTALKLTLFPSGDAFEQSGGGLYGVSSKNIILSHMNVVGNVALVRQLTVCEGYHVRVSIA